MGLSKFRDKGSKVLNNNNNKKPNNNRTVVVEEASKPINRNNGNTYGGQSYGRNQVSSKPKQNRYNYEDDLEIDVVNTNVTTGSSIVPVGNGLSLNALLGVGNKHLTIVQHKVLQVTPIDLPEVRDSYGDISTTLEDIEDRTGVSVIPLNKTPIFPNVIDLARHDIIEIKGVRYASGKTRVVNQANIDALVKEAVECVSGGQIFRTCALTQVEFNGEVIETLRFNIHEIEHIAGLLRKFNPKFALDDEGIVYIIIGDIYNYYSL